MVNFTHLDKNSRPKIVDISDKDNTLRVAVASGKIVMDKKAFDMVVSQQTKKGPVLQTAVIAALQGAKSTSTLIPMCHPLLLTSVECDIVELSSDFGFELEVTVKLTGKTGVEMEALTGVSIGLLTIYDMVKSLDKSMTIKEIKLKSKTGGKSGDFRR